MKGRSSAVLSISVIVVYSKLGQVLLSLQSPSAGYAERQLHVLWISVLRRARRGNAQHSIAMMMVAVDRVGEITAVVVQLACSYNMYYWLVAARSD